MADNNNPLNKDEDDNDEQTSENVDQEETTSETLTQSNISPPPSNVRLGKCKWFNVAKGWGFISPNDGGPDVFVHQSVIKMSGFRSLAETEEVEFEARENERGFEATRVSGPQEKDCCGSTFRPPSKKRYRRIRCYNCGLFANHIAAKCTLEPQPKKCHRCQSADHLVADCPVNVKPT